MASYQKWNKWKFIMLLHVQKTWILTTTTKQKEKQKQKQKQNPFLGNGQVWTFDLLNTNMYIAGKHL